MKKSAVFIILYGFFIILAFYYKDELVNWLKDSDASQIPVMFFISLVLSVVPLIPFSVFAGMMGSKYGVLIGGAINWFGAVGGALIFFLLARYFINGLKQYVNKFKGIQKLDDLIGRKPFLTVLFARIVYIIPPPIINIYSGLSPMSFKTYFFATAIGQIPTMVVYAYLGSQLLTSFQSFLQGLAIYIGFLLCVIFIYRKWFKEKSKILKNI